MTSVNLISVSQSNVFLLRMLITPLEESKDVNYSTGEIMETTKDANYSTGGI